MKFIAPLLLITILLLGSACNPSLVTVQPPNLDDVADALGYSLAPTRMLEGHEFDRYDVVDFLIDDFAHIVYGGQHNSIYQYISIMYPGSFLQYFSDVPIWESLEVEWQRPGDAVLEVRVNGEKAHIVQGSWSIESNRTLAEMDQDVLATFIPEWDYEIYLTLYFDYKLPSDETVGVMIHTMMPNPPEWITNAELIGIAESIVHTHLE